MKLKRILTHSFGIAILAGMLPLVACNTKSEKAEINGTTGKVTEVIDGNTIKLSNNIKVKLLGVKKSEEGKKFLERNVKGKKVKLLADSKDPKQYFSKGNNDVINAYVIVEGSKELNSVNGRMIRTEVVKLNRKGVKDSLEAFQSGIEIKEKLTDAELLALLKPRTFLIVNEDGSSGTGFYISSSGMALTNAHVLNFGNQGSIIVPFQENGNYDVSNHHKIERILYVGDDEYSASDFTIFEVSLNGEKVPYLDLAKQHELDGNKVAKMGCVKGEPAHFSTGNISHTINGVVSHSSKVNQGDSGSPLVNEKGEVIGINQSIKVNEQLGGDVGVYYAVDIQTLRDWFENHRDDQGQLRYGR